MGQNGISLFLEAVYKVAGMSYRFYRDKVEVWEPQHTKIVEEPNSWLHVAFGRWYRRGTQWEWYAKPPPPWVSISVTSTTLDITATGESDETFYVTVGWVSRDNYPKPSNPVDPMGPVNPDQPGSIKNVYAKMGGQLLQAKEIYTKQNGVIVPVKSIHTKP